jgi:ribosome-associated translation inhibitor RaiA
MSFPTTVTFHGTSRSSALRTHVLKRAKRLERFAADIRSCRVVIEFSERRHRQGNHFNVHGSVLLRGRAIEANRTPTASNRGVDPYVAVSDVFDALRRRVEDYVRRRRGDIKNRSSKKPAAGEHIN